MTFCGLTLLLWGPITHPQPQRHSTHRVLHDDVRVFLGDSAPFWPLEEALHGEGAQGPWRLVHLQRSRHPAKAQGQVLQVGATGHRQEVAAELVLLRRRPTVHCTSTYKQEALGAQS